MSLRRFLSNIPRSNISSEIFSDESGFLVEMIKKIFCNIIHFDNKGHSNKESNNLSCNTVTEQFRF